MMPPSPEKSSLQTPEAGDAPSEGRRERRKRLLRQRIFEQAAELFMRQGFEGTTVEQIAAAADVVPATFFNHFQNKRAVLVELTTQVVSHVQGLIDEAFERGGGTRNRLLGFADAAAADIEETRGIARDVVLTMVHSEAQPGEAAPFLRQVHEALAVMLREGQNAGDVRDDQEADFLAEMVVGLFNATITGWLGDSKYPIEKRLRQAAVFAWEAIQPGTPAAPLQAERNGSSPSNAAEASIARERVE